MGNVHANACSAGIEPNYGQTEKSEIFAAETVGSVLLANARTSDTFTIAVLNMDGAQSNRECLIGTLKFGVADSVLLKVRTVARLLNGSERASNFL